MLHSSSDGPSRATSQRVTRENRRTPQRELVLYQHDEGEAFRFVLVGYLEGSWVDELQHAWTTAASVIAGKRLVVNLAALAGADESGVELLSRMSAAGATIVPPSSPDAPEILLSFGPPASPRNGPSKTRFWKALAARLVPVGRQLP